LCTNLYFYKAQINPSKIKIHLVEKYEAFALSEAVLVSADMEQGSLLLRSIQRAVDKEVCGASIITVTGVEQFKAETTTWK
jgi:hypothetical protein